MLAFLGLIILSPIILVVLLITTIDLKYYPVFVQIRTIDGNKCFNFIKIRTMKKNSPNVPTSDFVDPGIYITKWGSFLRRNSIDEILNLVCILKGDMSFIGPRPIMFNEFDLIDLRTRSGITGKGGITGLAQVNGRDHIDLTRKVACERYYQRNCKSILLNVHILLKTLLIVLKKTDISH